MNNKTKPHDKNYKICGAKTRKGTPCLRPAGWGTKHQGTGRCKLHGGKSTGPKDREKQSKSQQKNKNAEKHGFFSKYLPEETMDIIQEIQGKDPLDILWENIQIQYAAIIRAQRIMHVSDKEEMIKELKKKKHQVVKVGGEHKQIPTEEEYEFQFAWDRQATYLQAQSRAMSELRSMIKQYDELLHANKDLATEEQKARIENIKANTSRITGENAEVEDLSEIYAEIYGDSNGDNKD